MSSRDLARIALFVGVIAALGLVPAISIAGMPAPVTAQTLGVMLAGSILGGRKGFLAALVFVLLVAIGLPLLPPSLTRPQGGLGVFSSGSVGYLLAWPLGALVTGLLAERAWERYNLAWGVAANVVGGILVIHLGGVLAVPLVTDLSLRAAFVNDLRLLPGDALKAVVGAAVVVAVRRAYPVARPSAA